MIRAVSFFGVYSFLSFMCIGDVGMGITDLYHMLRLLLGIPEVMPVLQMALIEYFPVLPMVLA